MEESRARFESLRLQIDEGIRSLFIHRKPESLYGPMAYPMESGGKRIRPILLILSCSASGGQIKDCLNAALAVEILHNFTLVHDDIMDHDHLRRGQPTVHEKWDDSTAILAGDGLVTLAYDTLLKNIHPALIRVLHCFTSGLLVLCEGQALDKEFETERSVSMARYEEMIRKKTSQLIEVSCEMGAILGGADEAETEALKRYARSLGTAFQIQDDLLDLDSEESVSGKPMGSDLMERKKTFLTIHFQEHADSGDLQTFRILWEKRNLTQKDIQKIKKLFADAGTFETARKEVGMRIETAVRALQVLRPSEARDDLRRLALKIRNRVA